MKSAKAIIEITKNDDPTPWSHGSAENRRN